MNEKEEVEANKENLEKIKRILDNLYDTDALDFILGDYIWNHIFGELRKKYLIEIDPESGSYSDDDEAVQAIKSIEGYGEDLWIGAKEGEYYLLSFDVTINDMKYWDIYRIKTDNLEVAKKVGELYSLLLEFI